MFRERVKILKFSIWKMCKVTIIFICCTCLFYFGLRAMHEEYEQYHRYDQPEGPAVKVIGEQDRVIDRLYLFFK